MNIFDAAFLGLIEGITEFLPISSTGHLILASSLLQLPNTDFQKMFEVVIQLGAILAVVALYWRSLLDIEVLKRIIVAFIPTGVIGLALYKVVKTYLIGNNIVVLAALLLGGIALIAFEYFYRESGDEVTDVRSITYKQAFFIGLCQSLAIIPGVSRSAATIVGGLLTSKVKRSTIVEFSFLLAVPTMAAASGLDLIKNASVLAGTNISYLAVGFIVAFFVALPAVKWLLSYVRSHTFTAFGVYRILAALVFFFILFR